MHDLFVYLVVYMKWDAGEEFRFLILCRPYLGFLNFYFAKELWCYMLVMNVILCGYSWNMLEHYGIK